MKNKIKFVVIYLSILTCVLGVSSLFLPNLRSVLKPVIDQNVYTERDGLNSVETLIWVDFHIRHSEYSFQKNGIDIGVPKDKVDSAKDAQMAHAKEWIRIYNKEKY